MIPLPGARTNLSTKPSGLLLVAPVRWAVRLLALIAIADAAYLAWEAINLQSVAGCAPSATIDCDLVLQSAWSKWLGIPVAFLGLAAYTSLLVLSFFAGRGRSEAARWASTALVALALVVAGAGLWFDALQFFSIQKFCLYCLGVHLCGLAIAGLIVWSALSNRTPRAAAPRDVKPMAGTLRPMPAAGRPAPLAIAGPSLSLACLGAIVLLSFLIGGQILFPPHLQVSKIVLPNSFDMNNSVATTTNTAPPSATTVPSPSAEEHVVNRIPAEETGAVADGHARRDDAKSKDDQPGKENSDKQGATATATKPATETSTEPEKPTLSRKVSFLKGTLTLDMYQQAVIGSPTAPHVVIEMVDYACPHCRAMHETVMKAIDRYGDQLAIVVLPMPLELECNKMMDKTEPAHLGACKLARLAIAVSEVDPGAFVDFHEWLMADKDKVPPIDRAISKAYRLTDAKKIRERVNSDEINQRIQNNIQLYTSLASEQAKNSKPFGLPIQIVGDDVISGDTVSGDELLTKWEEDLGMKPL
jgi:uncharacterized membrane protein/two-component sensor histidine kinase